MADRGIVHVGLKVSDLEKSRKFYLEILGLTSQERESGIAYLPSGKDLLVLYKQDAGATDYHFGFHVDTPPEVDEWRSWLRRSKVAIYEDIAEADYRSIKFRDPDGHWIEISYEKLSR
jgi:catechol 2,3-dioxygenase-like lactoylglutathione lyase family enzyme